MTKREGWSWPHPWLTVLYAVESAICVLAILVPVLVSWMGLQVYGASDALVGVAAAAVLVFFASPRLYASMPRPAGESGE